MIVNTLIKTLAGRVLGDSLRNDRCMERVARDLVEPLDMDIVSCICETRSQCHKERCEILNDEPKSIFESGMKMLAMEIVLNEASDIAHREDYVANA